MGRQTAEFKMRGQLLDDFHLHVDTGMLRPLFPPAAFAAARCGRGGAGGGGLGLALQLVEKRRHGQSQRATKSS